MADAGISTCMGRRERGFIWGWFKGLEGCVSHPTLASSLAG